MFEPSVLNSYFVVCHYLSAPNNLLPLVSLINWGSNQRRYGPDLPRRRRWYNAINVKRTLLVLRLGVFPRSFAAQFAIPNTSSIQRLDELLIRFAQLLDGNADGLAVFLFQTDIAVLEVNEFRLDSVRPGRVGPRPC